MSQRCDRTAAWAALQSHYTTHGQHLDVREAFRQDPERAQRFTVEAAGLKVDLSKNRVDAATWDLLLKLAEDCDVAGQREAQYRGAPINHTEGRAVMHWLLRQPAEGSLDHLSPAA